MLKARHQRQFHAIVSFALALAVGCGAVPRERVDWQESEPQLFTTGPYILVGGEGQAFIALKADLAEPPVVEWWLSDRDLATSPTIPEPTADAITSVRAVISRDLWVATLTGLPSGEHIGYRVRSTRGTSKPSSFRVGINPGERFRFAAFGDTRTGHNVHRAVIEAMTLEHIDFVIHTGDMVEDGNVEAQWDLFFQIERPLLVHTPIVPSIGNHDMGSRDYYRHYFLLRRWTDGLRYYAHDWGNLRIIAVDGSIECREGCAQYSRLTRLLQEGADNNMLMVMMLHYPPYSSGKHGSNKLVQKPISTLARQYGVELVVAGHDHNYERTKPIDGTTYIVSGSAGAPIRPVSPRWFTAEARTEPHYVLVDVEHQRMVIRAVNLRGDTFDTYVITPNPPQPSP